MRKLAATTLPNFIFSVLPLLNFFNGDKGTVQSTKINIVGGECPYITLTPSITYDNTLFLGFTMQIGSKSDWGSTSTALLFMLYWREQMTGNCTYLLPNPRPTHTVNI